MLAELEKLEANLGGVADMRRQPDAVFIVDLRKEQLAVREARASRAAGDRARRHELRPRRGRLRHPGQRRRDPLVRLIVQAIADGIEAGKQKVTAAEELQRRRETEAAPEAGARRRGTSRAAGRGRAEPTRLRRPSRQRAEATDAETAAATRR